MNHHEIFAAQRLAQQRVRNDAAIDAYRGVRDCAKAIEESGRVAERTARVLRSVSWAAKRLAKAGAGK